MEPGCYIHILNDIAPIQNQFLFTGPPSLFFDRRKVFSFLL